MTGNSLAPVDHRRSAQRSPGAVGGTAESGPVPVAMPDDPQVDDTVGETERSEGETEF
jgi:hypothetical protein